LFDLIQQISTLIPHRTDLVQQLNDSFDPELLTQMIRKDSLSPKEDLLPIFQFLYQFLTQLQAEYRLEYASKWWDVFSANFEFSEKAKQTYAQKKDYLGQNLLFKIAQKKVIPLSPASNEETNNINIQRITLFDILPLIPMYFERISESVEEIQRDMANYYISLLVPVLQTSGHEFLLNNFQQRLSKGVINLNVLTTLVISYLQPEGNNFKKLMTDFVECDICSPQGFTLAQLAELTTVPPNPSSSLGNNNTSQPEPVRLPLHEDYFKGIIAYVFLSVLQLPYRLDSPMVVQNQLLPETFQFDQTRLAKIRDLIDKITIENALLIMTKQFLSSQYRILFHENEEMEFIYRMDVILSQQDFTILHVSQEILRFTVSLIMIRKESLGNSPSGQHQGTQQSSSISPAPSTSANSSVPSAYALGGEVNMHDLEEKISKMVKDIIKEDNPILELFQKRIYKLLLRALLAKPFQQKLKQYSLHSKGNEKNFHQLFSSINHLFQHNYRVYYQVYQIIFLNGVRSILKSENKSGL
jgi:hypothetical protein